MLNSTWLDEVIQGEINKYAPPDNPQATYDFLALAIMTAIAQHPHVQAAVKKALVNPPGNRMGSSRAQRVRKALQKVLFPADKKK